MKEEQRRLLEQAQESLEAAELLREAGYYGFAASRAYYAMFYVAEALLLDKGLSFSKHAAVLAAFGEHLVKTGLVGATFHRALVRAMAVRHAGDDGEPGCVTSAEAQEQLMRAREFLSLGEGLLGTG
jgi:uncharacterized protein (UPF0332 family)